MFIHTKLKLKDLRANHNIKHYFIPMSKAYKGKWIHFHYIYDLNSLHMINNYFKKGHYM